MLTEKSNVGWDVSHKRKSRCTAPAFSTSSSTCNSSRRINPVHKWQFYRTTHVPRSAACWIIWIAVCSIPRPKLNACVLRPIRIVSANVIRSFIGSAMSFRRKRSGLIFVESLNDLSRLNTYGWLYSFPRIVSMYIRAYAFTRSERSALITKNFSSADMLWYGSGNYSYSGACASYTFVHVALSRDSDSNIPAYYWNYVSWMNELKAASGSQMWSACCTETVPIPPPTNSQLSSLN